MNSISPRGAQKSAHPFMNLHLEIGAGGIFAVNCENASVVDLDAVRVNFEVVLL